MICHRISIVGLFLAVAIIFVNCSNVDNFKQKSKSKGKPDKEVIYGRPGIIYTSGFSYKGCKILSYTASKLQLFESRTNVDAFISMPWTKTKIEAILVIAQQTSKDGKLIAHLGGVNKNDALFRIQANRTRSFKYHAYAFGDCHSHSGNNGASNDDDDDDDDSS